MVELIPHEEIQRRVEESIVIRHNVDFFNYVFGYGAADPDLCIYQGPIEGNGNRCWKLVQGEFTHLLSTTFNTLTYYVWVGDQQTVYQEEVKWGDFGKFYLQKVIGESALPTKVLIDRRGELPK